MNKIMFLLLSCIVAYSSINAMERYPLHEAIREGDIKRVEALLLSSNGADANKQDNDGEAPLHWAAYKDHLEIVKLLLANHADANWQDNDGKTPLHCAAHNGHLEIVKLLLDKGADANKQDNDGKTPLHWASYKGHLEIVELL